VNTLSSFEDLEDLARSLRSMIKVLIDLYPEGVGETFDDDAYLTILGKAEDDAKALMAALQKMPR
jgi:hypothetical protein